MRKLLILTLLLAPVPAHTQKTASADFPKTLHVVGADADGGLVGILDGQCLRLNVRSTTVHGLLAHGDYPAREAKYRFEPRHHAPFDRFLAYELLLPDGSTRVYEVGLSGAAVPGGCGTAAR